VAEDGADNAGGDIERVSIAEAAALLGCHPNTVRNRVKAGMYRAEKFHTENGPTWMIERASLTTNAPTTAPQQPVSVAPAAQQEAIQELARAIVREAGIAGDPKEQARLEGNKLASEAAKTLVIVGSGLLVGMAAVVGVMPEASLRSPSLYLAFAFVVASIFAGITWMREIAEITMSAEGDAMRVRVSTMAGGFFILGLFIFIQYVLFNYPGASHSYPPQDQLRWAVVTVTVLAALPWVHKRFHRWQEQRRSRGEAE
jgi:hypothetical protein